VSPDIKTLWLLNLRSNRFASGSYYLRDAKDRYNVLGVLCAVLVTLGHIEWAWLVNANAYTAVSQTKKPQKHLSTVPRDIAKNIGLDNRAQDKLAVMFNNGSDFLACANWIEENL
jgi:hypothetical protein